MLENSKVIWKEGMFLQPQHFQQLERYIFNSINSRMSIYHPFFYGILDVEIDRDALANNLLTLTRCSGTFSDGTVFSIPKEDLAPTARSFAEFFSHDQHSIDVFLALPVVLTNKPNVSSAVTGESYYNIRYKSKMAGIPDEVFGTLRKEIELGILNFQILFSGESLDDFSTLQIARLKRASNGQITIEDSYIPPILHISGSKFLMSILRSLLEMLVAKCNSLAQGRRQVEGGFAEFSSSEETAFRLLETLSTYTPLLNYYFTNPMVHPFDLYSLLMTFAGSLSAFSTEVSFKDFPQYNHHNLSVTFISLIKIIRTVLEADISAACVNIPVEQINQAVYIAKVPDEKLFKSAKFYFGVSAKVPEKELIVGILQRIKMSSRDRLELLISSAMPGLPLKHCISLPEELSTKPGYLYFSLDQNNPFWEGIKTSGTIAFYFPNNFPELKMEFLALKS